MTVRHLLAHTSGIGYAFCNPIVARLQRGNQKSEWEIPLLSDPGDKWNYSASTRVLGLIVEKITGTAARGLVSGTDLQTARHGRHIVGRRCRQTVARGEHPQPRDGHAAGAAAGDRFRPRRRRRSEAMAACIPLFETTACSCGCC